MVQGYCVLTVYFEDPFWVGLYEREEKDGYQVCKTTFGAEPKDYEVYEWLLASWQDLSFSPAMGEDWPHLPKTNFKRAKREARKSLLGPPVGTKAQEALKLQRIVGKELHRQKIRQERQAEAEQKFRLRQEKKHQKHKGR